MVGIDACISHCMHHTHSPGRETDVDTDGRACMHSRRNRCTKFYHTQRHRHNQPPLGAISFPSASLSPCPSLPSPPATPHWHNRRPGAVHFPRAPLNRRDAALQR